jgi:urease accessory protein
MNSLADMRLLQLASQALPIGGYSHSQGLEPAIETGVVRDEASVATWIEAMLIHCIISFEVPYLRALHRAWSDADSKAVMARDEEFLASRETAELRAATVQMGYSLRSLLMQLPDLPDALLASLSGMHEPSLPCVWTGAAVAWEIGVVDAVRGYLWSWAENQVLVAVKALPMGQSAGQRVLFAAGAAIARIVDAIPTDDGEVLTDLSNFAPALAIASARHETQYSRLFRS